MKLSEPMERFVLHWGEMGTRWGVNRSVAQVHALLFLADRPLHAEEIAETLGIARSNVSTSLRELMGWRLVSLVHALGDRRDHFSAEKDCWTMLRLIAQGRKQREIDPTLTTVRACALDAEADPDTPPEARRRMAETLEFLEELDGWFGQMVRLPQGTLRSLVSLGARVARLLPSSAAKEREHG